MTVDHYIATELPKMKVICGRIAKRFQMDGDDHLQNCLINAIRLQKGYVHESESRFFGWWSTVCYNQAINEYRRLQKIPPMVDAEWAANIHAQPNRIDDRNRLAAIYWQIRRQKGTKWALITYLIAQRYKYEEVGEIVGVPTGTVRSILYRIREILTQNPQNMAENEEKNWVNPVPTQSTQLTQNATKQCRGKCGQIKPIEKFSKHSGNKDGLQDICKQCQSDFMRDYNARKALERKAQLTAGDINLTVAPKPAPLTSAGKAVKKELIEKKVIPRQETQVLPPGIHPNAKLIEESVKLRQSIGKPLLLTDEEKAIIMNALDRHVAVIEKIIEKLSS